MMRAHDISDGATRRIVKSGRPGSRLKRIAKQASAWWTARPGMTGFPSSLNQEIPTRNPPRILVPGISPPSSKSWDIPIRKQEIFWTLIGLWTCRNRQRLFYSSWGLGLLTWLIRFQPDASLYRWGFSREDLISHTLDQLLLIQARLWQLVRCEGPTRTNNNKTIHEYYYIIYNDSVALL